MNTKTKDTHEEASIIRFLTLYNDLDKNDLSFLKLGDPNKKEPDGICSNDVAVELVGAYDNSYQARKIWSAARGKDSRAKPELRLLTFENLTQEIATKLEKLNNGNYDGFTGKIVLLCNLPSPLLTDSDVDTFMSKYI
ncbi:MAG: hypothetical protein WC437_05730, partial [Patescibacteria group bacterium]